MSPALACDLSGELVPADFPEGVWRVPLEMVLAASSSAYVSVIRRRQATGTCPATEAVVFVRDGWFFAEVAFAGPGRPSLLFRLDLPLWENREARQSFGLRRAAP